MWKQQFGPFKARMFLVQISFKCINSWRWALNEQSGLFVQTCFICFSLDICGDTEGSVTQMNCWLRESKNVPNTQTIYMKPLNASQVGLKVSLWFLATNDVLNTELQIINQKVYSKFSGVILLYLCVLVEPLKSFSSLRWRNTIVTLQTGCFILNHLSADGSDKCWAFSEFRWFGSLLLDVTALLSGWLMEALHVWLNQLLSCLQSFTDC